MKIKSIRSYCVPLLSLLVIIYAGLASVPPKSSYLMICSQFPGCVVQVTSFQSWPSLR